MHEARILDNETVFQALLVCLLRLNMKQEMIKSYSAREGIVKSTLNCAKWTDQMQHQGDSV